MSAATAEAPEVVKAPPIVTRHLFHMKCNDEQGSVQVSYCGMRFKAAPLTNWSPRLIQPDNCAMCLEARASTGCPKCGVKP